jgi:cyanobactin maturation PatA/PatG family protease
MDLRTALPGLAQLQQETLGDGAVCIAVLDGPVDLDHPCFAGAGLRRVGTLVRDAAGPGRMSQHGTHVASLIFGQPGSPVEGVAPRCRGLLLPVFRDDLAMLPQLDLARAIEQAVDEGAHVISISGGERAPTGEADGVLDNALKYCAMNNVLVVAAVGNDGCDCLQVPAARPSVLAVGAATADGEPLPSSNWGAAYRENGVLTCGHEIDGAVPGGGVTPMTGSSIATPIVAGVAGLLLSVQHQRGREPDPGSVRAAILGSASGARSLTAPATGGGSRRLAGNLDIAAARESVAEPEGGTVTSADPTTVTTIEPTPVHDQSGVGSAAAATTAPVAPTAVGDGVLAACAPAGSAGCGCGAAPAAVPPAIVVPTRPTLVYAIGNIDFDFGTEAARDGFKQAMPDFEMPGYGTVPPNPLDPVQLHHYLRTEPWASNKVNFLLSLDRTAIFALEAEVPYGMAWGGPEDGVDGPGYPPVSFVHKVLRDALWGQTLDPSDDNYVARVSVPGVLTDRSIRLYNGQHVPVLKVQSQGLYTWNEAVLVRSVVDDVVTDHEQRQVAPVDPRLVEETVRTFLDKVYYQFRNLGTTAPDRALNYAATNAFQLTKAIASGFLSGSSISARQSGRPESLYALDDITVVKSPYDRIGGECWDIRISFFDPENDRRARSVLQLTVDVAANPPVTVGDARKFLLAR